MSTHISFACVYRSFLIVALIRPTVDPTLLPDDVNCQHETVDIDELEALECPRRTLTVDLDVDDVPNDEPSVTKRRVTQADFWGTQRLRRSQIRALGYDGVSELLENAK